MIISAQETEKTEDTSSSHETMISAESAVYSIGDRGPGGGTVFISDGDTRMEVSVNLGFLSWTAAKNATENYRGGGYSDWRLPTKDELNLIYQNLRRKGLGAMGDDIHWTSTEFDASNAWYQSFGNGIQRQGNIRSFSLAVRAVREF